MINYGHTHEVYSTDEFQTDAEWIDGKTVYRRCFYATALAANASHTLGTLTGLGSLVSLRGTWKSGDSWQKPVNYFVNTGDYSFCQVDASRAVVFKSTSACSWICVVAEYTKA